MLPTLRPYERACQQFVYVMFERVIQDLPDGQIKTDDKKLKGSNPIRLMSMQSGFLLRFSGLLRSDLNGSRHVVFPFESGVD